MNSALEQYGQYFYIALGIYCIVRGIITLTTGRLTAGEEAKLSEYSKNGARRYKMLSAVSNLLGGVFVIVVSVLKIFGILKGNLFRVIALVIVAALVVVYILIRNSCKNIK